MLAPIASDACLQSKQDVKCRGLGIKGEVFDDRIHGPAISDRPLQFPSARIEVMAIGAAPKVRAPSP